MSDGLRFRVWSKSNKKYVDRHVIGDDGLIYLLGDIGDEYYELIEQNNVIIERCTGLKDKHGNLIYEGDIVCYDDTPYNGYATKKIGVVVYRKAQFCYKYSDCLGGLYQPLVPSDDFWQRKTEIIGNVHEMKVCEECGEEKENVN